MHLKHLRQLKNMNQKQLAHKVGCSQAEICLYELGERMPTYKRILAISEALGIAESDISIIDWKACDPTIKKPVRKKVSKLISNGKILKLTSK